MSKEPGVQIIPGAKRESLTHNSARIENPNVLSIQYLPTRRRTARKASRVSILNPIKLSQKTSDSSVYRATISLVTAKALPNIRGLGSKSGNNINERSSFLWTTSVRRFSSGNGIVKNLPEMGVSNTEIVEVTTTGLAQIQSKKILYSQVFDMVNLQRGLNKLRNKAPGVDGETKANITPERLLTLQKDLKGHKYVPKPSKRIEIPKPGGGTRHLGIASAIDKVVQSTLLILLSPIVEETFSPDSFGFRPGLGCHDALHRIRYG
jgi:hypothetical protein